MGERAAHGRRAAPIHAPRGTAMGAAALLTVAAIITTLGVGVAVRGGVAALPMAPVGAPVALPDSVPPLPARSVPTAASPVEANAPITVTVSLNRDDQAGFDNYLAGVGDPASPAYRQYLTQTQLADRFGPGRDTYDAVVGWLTGRGLRPTQGSANRLTVTVTGSRAQVGKAFGTRIDEYTPPSGVRFYAPAAPPAIPRALAPHIQAVTGLSDAARPSAVPVNQWRCDHGYGLSADGKAVLNCANLCAQGTVGPPIRPYGLFGVIAKLFADVGFLLMLLPSRTLGTGFSLVMSPEDWAYCAGASMANAAPGLGNWVVSNWGVSTGRLRRPGTALTSHPGLGAGRGAPPTPGPAQKVGLLEFDTYRSADVADWVDFLGLDPSLLGRLSNVAVNGGVASPGPGESEVLVDIEAVLGGTSLAPTTSVVVYHAPPTTSFLQMFQAMIADGDTVISNSWSQCEDQTSPAEAHAIDAVLANAAAAGVTVLNGSGDHGSACLDGSAATVGVPADSPHATAVGGTTPSFGPGLSYGHESYWDDTDATPPGGAGGFGVSRFFPRPAYQNGFTTSTMRSVPDIAFNADPAAGIAICQADAGGCPDGRTFGGTSLAAPEVAALVADLNHGLGHNIGDLNAALYPLAGTAALHSAAGMASDFAHVGLGSPDFTAILQRLAGVATRPADAASAVVYLGRPQADGQDAGFVRIDLTDSNGFPVRGKHITLTPDPGSSAVVSSSVATTDPSGGVAAFAVTDTTAETVTFTVTDTTDHLTLTTQPVLTFTTPTAVGAQIYGGPAVVKGDGTAAATITAYLADALGRAAVGKTVTLSAAAGHAVIRPAGSTTPGTVAVTDSSGNATFTVTDSSVEAVSFTAVDTTDADLPIPGSVLINFTADGQPACAVDPPTPTAGSGVSTFANGFAHTDQTVVYPGNFTVSACSSFQTAPAFDASGNAYIGDTSDGSIHVVGPGGGTAGPANALPAAHFPGGALGQLAFGKDGALYAGLIQTGGTVTRPQIVRIDPVTGTTIGVVADTSTGLPDCPFVLVTDPLSGDLFADDECSGYAASDQITRIHDPGGPSPTVSGYIHTGAGHCNLGMSFAPDGTLYLAACSEIDLITGTGTATPTLTKVISAPAGQSIFSVAVTAADPDGHATTLTAFSWQGTALAVDLTQSPAVATTIASGPAHFFITASAAHDCAYGTVPGTVVRVGPAACGSAGQAAGGPSLTLTVSGPDQPPAGSPVTLSARLAGASNPSGTPIRFIVTGPDRGAALRRADSTGAATMTLTGLTAGVDTVVAVATVDGADIASAPQLVHWKPGKATTFLSLNASVQAGVTGVPTTVTATLLDISDPFGPVSGKTVRLTLGGAWCTGTTNSVGTARCTLTPTGSGLAALQVSFAGDAHYVAASAATAFQVRAPYQAPPTGSTTSSATSTSAASSASSSPGTSPRSSPNSSPGSSPNAVTSTAAPSPPLADTGFDARPLLWAALALLAVGAALALGRRRASRHRAH